jgi:glycosyltransferase involved in cell wall biosynthesis
MKIIQVCPKYFPEIGGVETHVKELSEWLVRKGHEVDVVCTDPTGQYSKFEIINGVKIYRFFSFAPSDSYFFAPQIIMVLKNKSYDIMHAHNYRAFPMFLSALAYRNESSKKYIITTHLGFSKTFKTLYKIYNLFFGNYICKKAFKIIIVSPAEILEIPFIKKYQNKISFIPNGVDFNKVCTHFIEDTRTTEKFNILFVGRIEKRKGIDRLMVIAKNSQEVPFQIIIVGDGPYRDHYETVVKNMKLGDKIVFKGKISEHELLRLYSQSHIFLLLSEYEAHSIALTEAMSFGLVPIVTDVGGNSYIVKNGETGFLVNYPVQDGNVETIIQNLWMDKDLFNTISESARQEIKNNYEINHVFDQILNIYTI